MLSVCFPNVVHMLTAFGKASCPEGSMLKKNNGLHGALLSTEAKAERESKDDKKDQKLDQLCPISFSF